jgi:hypothetical protein
MSAEVAVFIRPVTIEFGQNDLFASSGKIILREPSQR